MKLRARDSYLYAAILLFGYLLVFDRPLLAQLFFETPWWAWLLVVAWGFLVAWALFDHWRMRKDRDGGKDG